MTFKDLTLNVDILRAIDELGFVTPTEVQAKSIPLILKHMDLIVKSKTGSGKTAAFGIPILHHLSDSASKTTKERVNALILTPTRELAVQVSQDIQALARFLPITCTTVYGQHSMNVEIEALERGSSIVVGTPGRVMDHIRQGNLETKHIQYFVLDEADKMMDMGFLDQVVAIIKNVPKKRTTMLFSATMPFEIQNICWEHMQNPETIEIASETKTVDTIDQLYYRVEHHEKRLNLHRLLLKEKPESCMVFCNTRATVDRVQEFLEKKGFICEALHGAITQAKRLKTIERFKAAQFEVLVATDVAARGLHVEDLSLVINYDLPTELDSYVHRIGRTGRAGNGGKAISLVTAEDQMTLYALEEHIGALIPEATEDLLAGVNRSAIHYAGNTHSHSHSQSRSQSRSQSHAQNQSQGRSHNKSNTALGASANRLKSRTKARSTVQEQVQVQHKSHVINKKSQVLQKPQPRVHGRKTSIVSKQQKGYSAEEIALIKSRYQQGSSLHQKKSWISRAFDGVLGLIKTKR